MYTNKLFSAISILLISLSTTTLIEAQTINKASYPPVDQPPPPVASWTALVDQTKVPKAPIRTIGGPCPPTDTFCTWSCTTCTRPETDVVDIPKKNEWALTYDDGPTNFTLRVLDALNERGIKATFFVIGSRVIENPTILKKIVDSGHQIGVHTWSHTPLTTQTNEVIIAETKWTEMAIKEAVGLTPKWFRAPQGDCDDRVRGILKQLGYKIAFWNRDTFDWKSNQDPTYDLNWIPGNFTEWVKNKTSSVGFVSLEHDAFDKTTTMTAKAMDIVLNAKFRPESLSVALGDQNPYVEKVDLPKSKIQGDKPDSSGTSAATPASNDGGKSSASSIEKNASLSVLCGLILMIFGIYA